MKRILNLLAASIGLIFLSPILCIIAIISHFKIGPPIILRQQRPGLKCKPFTFYKFRTMINVRNKYCQPREDKERLTNWGEFLRSYSLDELPQLWNVIKGDINLVGPRPLLMEYLECYNPEQSRRHEVKPGITGWAQINGRNAITWEQKFELDVWYVDHQSFWLDIKILWLTLIKVLRREDINASGEATMPLFIGSKKDGDQDNEKRKAMMDNSNGC